MATLSAFGGQVVFTTSGETITGQYADGSWWASHGGAGVTLTAATPDAGVISRTTLQGVQSLYSHGIMINPGEAERYKTAGPALTTLALKQRYAHGAPSNGHLGQGWDAYFFSSSSTIVYNSAYSTALPSVLTEGVWTKAKSFLTEIERGHILEYLAPLTVIPVAKEPAAGGCRPGYANPDKTSRWTKSQINMSIFGERAHPTFTPQSYAWCLDRLLYADTHAFTYNVFNRGILPANGSALFLPYNGYISLAQAEAMLSLHYTNMSLSQKRDVAFLLCQKAEDVRAAVLQGKIWPDNGGHSSGRKTLLVFAEKLLPGLFSDAINVVVESATNASTPIPLGASIFGGDDGQYFTITQADIDRLKAYPYTQNMLGVYEWSSDATRDDATSEEAKQNSLNVNADLPGGTLAKQSYRYTVGKGSTTASLALRLMDGVATWNKPAWFDYQDRYMNARIARGAQFVDANGNDNPAWTISAWVQDRNAAAAGGGSPPPIASSKTQAGKLLRGNQRSFQRGRI